MRYLSVCAGIEAASVAWHHMGWTPVAFSEIEPFPCAVLAHHYPHVPNWGDMIKFSEWPDACRCVSNRHNELSSEKSRTFNGDWSAERPSIHIEQIPSSCGGNRASNKGSICEQCGGTIIDVLVGGTPCQSFSVAGLRKGLDDPRGNLALTYLAIADRYRPEWLVWENVPGVLSSNGGRDFGSFLGGLAELGYGFAYRILDAQYFGVAQRRRRVFVVANARSWQRAAAVLFERESLCGNPAPRREAGEKPTGTLEKRFGGGATELNGVDLIPELCGPLNARDYKDIGTDGLSRNSAKMIPVAFPWQSALDPIGTPADLSGTLVKNQTMAVAFGGEVARSLTARHDSSPCADRGMDVVAVAQPVAFAQNQLGEVRMGEVLNTLNTNSNASGRNTPMVAQPVPYDFYQITAPVNRQNREPGDPCHTLARDNAAHATIVQPVYGIDAEQNVSTETMGTLRSHQSGGHEGEKVALPVAPSLTATNDPSRSPQSSEVTQQVNAVYQAAMQVRRLTPRECERLQGFPDDYTLIPYRGKTAADGPRYKALGNSMAVPVMRWIGQRIQSVKEAVR